MIKQQIELSDLRLHDAIKCHTHIVLVQFWKFSVFGISDWVYFWNWWQAVEKMSKDFRKQCSNPVPNCRTTLCIGSLLTICEFLNYSEFLSNTDTPVFVWGLPKGD